MSEPVAIPLPAGVPLFEIRTILDGTEYRLRFDWHAREARWYFDVLDIDGTPITAGIKAVQNWPLYDRETHENAPKGTFVLHTPDGLPAGLADLGVRSTFAYIPKGAT